MDLARLASAGGPTDQPPNGPARANRMASWAWQKVLLSALAGGALLPLSAMDLIRPSNVSACSAAVSIPTVSASIYVPVTPVRLVDTSSGLGFPPMGAGATSTL